MYPRVDKCVLMDFYISVFILCVYVSHIHTDDLLEDCSLVWFFFSCFVLSLEYTMCIIYVTFLFPEIWAEKIFTYIHVKS